MKKTKILLKLLTLAITIIGLSSCGCKDEVTFYLPQDYKDCYVFPEGSWWIYTVNGEPFDTLTLLKTERKFQGDDCVSQEYYEFTYNSNVLGESFIPIEAYATVFEGKPVVDVNDLNWAMQADKLLVENPMEPIRYFGGGVFGLNSVDELTELEQRKKAGGYWLVSIRDSLLIENQYELRVYKTLDSAYLFDNDPWLLEIIDNLPPCKVYYARGIGIIRKEMYNGDVWELSEYFINN